MTEWATAAEFSAWSEMSLVKDADEGTLARALKRARLTIISLCRRTPDVSEAVLEAMYIVAERIILGKDQTVLATSARGLASAQFGDHSISFGAGSTQNPFVTPEVLVLLEPEMSKFPSAQIATDKVVVAGDYGYGEDGDPDFLWPDRYYSATRGPYPYIP